MGKKRKKNKRSLFSLYKRNKKNQSKTEEINSIILPEADWFLIGASEIGSSHLASDPPVPCQDSHAYVKINDQWGICIVSDGAGSAPLSHKGSQFVCSKALEVFVALVQEKKWADENILPSEEEWNKSSRTSLLSIKDSLKEFAQKQEVEFRHLACTAIIVIYSPFGILATHIGDGRSAYLNKDNEWKALINPHESEEDSITIFLTSSWEKEGYEMNEVPVPESVIISQSVKAICLMSDGMEFHSFDLGYFDEEKNYYFSKNEPFLGFFTPVFATLSKIGISDLTQEEKNDKWGNFIRAGSETIKNEQDDKTMLFAINLKADGH